MVASIPLDEISAQSCVWAVVADLFCMICRASSSIWSGIWGCVVGWLGGGGVGADGKRGMSSCLAARSERCEVLGSGLHVLLG
jgi:hypothetical protein